MTKTGPGLTPELDRKRLSWPRPQASRGHAAGRSRRRPRPQDPPRATPSDGRPATDLARQLKSAGAKTARAPKKPPAPKTAAAPKARVSAPLKRKPSPRERRAAGAATPSEIQTGAASAEPTRSAAAAAPPEPARDAPPPQRLAPKRRARAPHIPRPTSRRSRTTSRARSSRAARRWPPICAPRQSGEIKTTVADDIGEMVRSHRPSGRILHDRSPAGVRGANDADQAVRRPLGFDPAAPAGRTGAAGRRARRRATSASPTPRGATIRISISSSRPTC